MIVTRQRLYMLEHDNDNEAPAARVPSRVLANACKCYSHIRRLGGAGGGGEGSRARVREGLRSRFSG
jgi:hypothetical protein